MFCLKRNGEKARINFNKISTRLDYLMGTDLNIDSNIITQKIASSIYNGIETSKIDVLAASICQDMKFNNVDFDTLSSRILISDLHKNTQDDFFMKLDMLKNNKDKNGVVSPLIGDNTYNIAVKHQKIINNTIDYKLDYLFDFFAIKTLLKSYLLKVDDVIVERPQDLFMRVSLGIHGDDINSVVKTYQNLSNKNYTHATPTLFNAGGRYPQMSSCYLIGTEDSVEGIFNTISDCAKISKWAGGIGIHVSNIRSNGSYIAKTGGKSDGILPMLKVYNDVARYINQGGGKRNGSFAIYLEPHHADVFSFIDAKKPHGNDNDRARDLFYAIWSSDCFMKAVEKNSEWYLMDPNICTGLNECYGDKYEELYYNYVKEGKYVKKIEARELWSAIISSQIETGGPYMGYKDSVNSKSNQSNLGVIKSSNLCIEIEQYSDDKETAVCNLASICLPKMLSYVSDDKDSYFYKNSKNQKIINDIYNKDYKNIVYSIDNCSYCMLLKGLLKSNKIPFEEIVVDNPSDDQTFPQFLIQKTTIGGEDTDFTIKSFREFIGGYSIMFDIIKPVVNFDKLENIAYDLVVNLNKIIDVNYYPTEQAKYSNMKNRPIGIGVQGLADVFLILKTSFSSTDAKLLNMQIFESIYHGCIRSTIDQAKLYGKYDSYDGSWFSKGKLQFDLWEEGSSKLSGRYDWNKLKDEMSIYGCRNSLLTALMPTASTSQIMGSYVEAFEPLTSNLYTRRTLSGEFVILNPYLMKDLIDLNILNDETRNRMIYDEGSVKNLKIPDFLKEIYKTAFEISTKVVIELSADRAVFVDQSQSLNLFIEKPDFKLLTQSHFYGWKSGLKTGSYYIRSKPSKSAQKMGLDIDVEKSLENECTSCSA